jgi:hypothetical protein
MIKKNSIASKYVVSANNESNIMMIMIMVIIARHCPGEIYKKHKTLDRTVINGLNTCCLSMRQKCPLNDVLFGLRYLIDQESLKLDVLYTPVEMSFILYIYIYMCIEIDTFQSLECEATTAVVMKNSILWDITLCRQLKVNDPENVGDMFLRNVS